MTKKLLFILWIFLLWTMVCGLWTLSAQERTVTLDISATNPLDEETQEVEVKADLPQELKKEDIISSDGLEVGFDEEKGSLFVAGKVTLQPAETTIYKIKVRDVWVIAEGEIRRLKEEVSRYPGLKISEILGQLDKISDSQKESVGEIGKHVKVYRENRKEFEKIKGKLQVARSTLHAARKKGRIVIWLTILAAILGTGIFIGRRHLKGLALWAMRRASEKRRKTHNAKRTTQNTYMVDKEDIKAKLYDEKTQNTIEQKTHNARGR